MQFGIQKAKRLIKKRRKAVAVQQRQLTGARRRLEAAKQKLELARTRRNEASEWGGSRAVTNEIIHIVNGRASISSRKRTETFGNPDSDHHVSQKLADAVDFRIANAFSLADEIAQRLGGPENVDDFQAFNIRRNGHTYRVQLIAGTHGTGPHLHAGVRRV